MNQQYIVACNAMNIAVADDLQGWVAIEPRFRPFAASVPAKPVLEVDIKVGAISAGDAERIYEPVHTGPDIIVARALRGADGCLVMEFDHASGLKPRLLMKMSAQLNRADITISSDGGRDDSYFLGHALMIAYLLATCGNGTLLIHASSVLAGGKAYLFQGRSGTGKSTHAALWTRHVEGAELLNDDHPVIRFTPEGVAMAYGSPWSGKTHCYRNLSAPIGAFVRIVRGEDNELRRLAPLKAYASLTASVFFLPFLSDKLRDMRHTVIERLVESVTCCEMHCRPDADAALTCRRGLSAYTETQN